MNETVFVCCPRFCCQAIGRNVVCLSFFILLGGGASIVVCYIQLANTLPRMVAHRDLPLFQVNCFTENLMKEVEEGDEW